MAKKASARSTGTRTGGLQRERESWYRKACARIDKIRLRDLTLALTRIHSPTGAERRASEFMADYLNSVRIPARYQPINELTGNCIGRVRGSGGGPTLMLYAPIDTHLDADASRDVPWVGPSLRDDMRPDAYLRGDVVIGLGASNPKSMVCTLTEALTCVVEAGVPLTGDVLLATAGGGMPWIATGRNHHGCSSGVMHMMQNGVAADFGIIFKPWDEVYYEHPGMCWFKVTTWGTMGYSGIPRGTPGFTSSIIPAARVMLDLESWLAAYPGRHTTAQVRPEGWIAAVRSGWPEKPAFPAAATEIYIDIRTNPDQSPAALEAEFDATMRAIVARHPDVTAEWEMYASCRGSRTPADHWIVRSCTRAWEHTHGRVYPGAALLSGQTDAATLCQLGLPLVRLGYPWVGDKVMPPEFSAGLGGMGVANIADLLLPCRTLIRAIIDSCTRTREECGLAAAT